MQNKLAKLGACIACLIWLLPEISFAIPDESLLHRLFRMIRPKSQYTGSLSSAFFWATQKDGSQQDNSLSALFFVDVNSGSVVEWKRGRGSEEPAACPDGKMVFVRRGNHIEAISINWVGKILELPDTESAVNDLRAQQLFSCTIVDTADGIGYLLWLQAESNEFVSVRLDGPKARVTQRLVDKFRESNPQEVAAIMRKLQAMRGDGASAIVRDNHLEISRLPDGRDSRAIHSEVNFIGTPAWLGDSNIVVATGAVGE